VKQDPGLWKIAPPENHHGYAEAAGLDKEESDFVSKYLSLADQLLKQDSRENQTPTPQEKPTPVPEQKPIPVLEQKPTEENAPPRGKVA
jgi:hypothetical protein